MTLYTYIYIYMYLCIDDVRPHHVETLGFLFDLLDPWPFDSGTVTP